MSEIQTDNASTMNQNLIQSIISQMMAQSSGVLVNVGGQLKTVASMIESLLNLPVVTKYEILRDNLGAIYGASVTCNDGLSHVFSIASVSALENIKTFILKNDNFYGLPAKFSLDLEVVTTTLQNGDITTTSVQYRHKSHTNITYEWEAISGSLPNAQI